METVAVLVRLPETYQGREAVVQIPESAFAAGCWKTIAALAAAVDLAVPFTDVERVARYGLRPEDKARLGQAAGDGERRTSSARPYDAQNDGERRTSDARPYEIGGN